MAKHHPPTRKAAKRKEMMSNAAIKLREAGRGGDTILAHISPAEAQVLRKMGGSGGTNPKTGLPEFSHSDTSGGGRSGATGDRSGNEFSGSGSRASDEDQLTTSFAGDPGEANIQAQPSTIAGDPRDDPFDTAPAPELSDEPLITQLLFGAPIQKGLRSLASFGGRTLAAIFGPGTAPRVSGQNLGRAAGVERDRNETVVAARRGGVRATPIQAAIASAGKSLKRTTPTLTDQSAIQARFVQRRRTAASQLASTRKTGGEGLLSTPASTTRKKLFGGI